MRVLIVRLDHLGDVLLTTPLIRAAVKAGHETHVLVRENCAPPIADNPAVTLHTIENVAPGFPGSWPRLGLWMRKQKFGTILLPHAKPRQLLLASAMSGAKRRIAMWAGLLGRLTLHECLRSGMRTGTRHFAEIPLDCARAAGFPTDGLKPDFFLTAPEIETARAGLAERFPGLKVVGIHPGCAGNTCNLPPGEYGRLAAMLLEEPGIAIVGTGIASEKKLFESWPVEVLGHPRFYNACGQWSLRQLAAHVASFATMVVPSTGPLHIAAAFAIPTVSAFCQYLPVSATLWGNLTPGAVVVSPPAEFCARRRAAGGENCDFEGQVDVAGLKRGVLEILAHR
jgi:ADP-heptose:LPS heptosyltransferase